MKIKRLRKIITKYRHYAVIMSEGMFGDFFGYVGLPNDSFRVVLGRNRKDALRRYLERYRRIHNHYPDYYMKGYMFRECPKKFGFFCVIDETKRQTFYRI